MAAVPQQPVRALQRDPAGPGVHRMVWLADLHACEPKCGDGPHAVFRLVRPSTLISCVRVMGVVVRLEPTPPVVHIDDGTATMAVSAPKVLARGTSLGDMVEVFGRLRTGSDERRWIEAHGLRVQRDPLWEPMRMIQVLSGYANKFSGTQPSLQVSGTAPERAMVTPVTHPGMRSRARHGSHAAGGDPLAQIRQTLDLSTPHSSRKRSATRLAVTARGAKRHDTKEDDARLNPSPAPQRRAPLKSPRIHSEPLHRAATWQNPTPHPTGNQKGSERGPSLDARALIMWIQRQVKTGDGATRGVSAREIRAAFPHHTEAQVSAGIQKLQEGGEIFLNGSAYFLL